MSRLVDMDALILNVEAAKNNNRMGKVVADAILQYIKKCRPIAVVQCKDCEYCEHKRYDIIGYKDVVVDFCKLSSENIRKVSPWDFCSWGRKEK